MHSTAYDCTVAIYIYTHTASQQYIIKTLDIGTVSYTHLISTPCDTATVFFSSLIGSLYCIHCVRVRVRVYTLLFSSFFALYFVREIISCICYHNLTIVPIKKSYACGRTQIFIFQMFSLVQIYRCLELHCGRACNSEQPKALGTYYVICVNFSQKVLSY